VENAMNTRIVICALAVPLLCAAEVAPRGGAVAQIAPAPGPKTVFPDNRYVWFLYRGGDPPRLAICRVDNEESTPERGLACELFSAPAFPDERFCASDAYGDWVWFLTNRGIRRIGRLPPIEGRSERFEPDLLKPEIIGYAPVGLVVADARIVVGGDRGLFVFDRHLRRLIAVTDVPVEKLVATPLGIVVQTSQGLSVLEVSGGAPTLRAITMHPGKNWKQEVPPEAWALPDTDGAAIVVMTGNVALRFPLAELRFERAPNERLREACLYRKLLWLLTTRRLVALDPAAEDAVEYDLSEIDVPAPRFLVQRGALRCGPIAVRPEEDRLVVQAVSLQAGPQALAQPLNGTQAQRTREK
jgi:hypothetical protein